MRSHKDAKAMAKSLRDVLTVRGVSLSHSECLEIVARQFGFADWNTFSSKLNAEESGQVRRRDRVSASDTASQSTSVAPPRAAGGIVESVPVMPLRDVVVYPGMMIPLFAGRAKTILAADTAMRAGKPVMLVTQRQPDVNEPAAEHLYQIGTVASLKEVSNVSTAARRILVEGFARAHIDALQAGDTLSARVTLLEETAASNGEDVAALRKAVMTRFEQYAKATAWPAKTWKTPPEPPGLAHILGLFEGLDAGRFADTIAAHAPLPLTQRQQVLEILDVRKRLEYLDSALSAPA